MIARRRPCSPFARKGLCLPDRSGLVRRRPEVSRQRPWNQSSGTLAPVWHATQGLSSSWSSFLRPDQTSPRLVFDRGHGIAAGVLFCMGSPCSGGKQGHKRFRASKHKGASKVERISSRPFSGSVSGWFYPGASQLASDPRRTTVNRGRRRLKQNGQPKSQPAAWPNA